LTGLTLYTFSPFTLCINSSSLNPETLPFVNILQPESCSYYLERERRTERERETHRERERQRERGGDGLRERGD